MFCIVGRNILRKGAKKKLAPLRLSLRRCVKYSSIDKGLLPEFKPQKLKNLEVIVFAAGKVRVDDPFYLIWPEDAATFYCRF
jgi:hypothetical protein